MNFGTRNELKAYETERRLAEATNRVEAFMAAACLLGLAVWAAGKYLGVWA